MNPLRTLKRMVRNSDVTVRNSDATVQGIANQSDLINRLVNRQSDLINQRLRAVEAEISSQSDVARSQA